MRVRLTPEELTYLSTATFVQADVAESLKRNSGPEGLGLSFDIPEDRADELRDLLGEELQRDGFDLDYRTTAKGKLLEQLIDKFFSG